MKRLAVGVLEDFDVRFPPNRLLKAMGIMHPAGFWQSVAEQPSSVVDALVDEQVAALKDMYGCSRQLADGTQVDGLIEFIKIQSELWCFKKQMQQLSNSYDHIKEMAGFYFWQVEGQMTDETFL